MSEELSDQYGLQISGKVHGDLVVVRGRDADDLKTNVTRLAELADEIVTSWGDFKTAAVAKGVFTGDAVGGPASTTRKSSPPAETSDGGTPKCKHGEMKDLRGKGYKNDFFCPEKDRDKQCKPVKL